MAEHEIVPQYRYRGSVKPSAEVARPVAARRTPKNATGDKPNAGTSATLDIFDVIDSYGGWWGISATDVDAALKAIGEVETLYVRLNSPGGEATEGVAIANLLRAHPANVRVTVYGMAASAASYIAIAGDTVNMGPGSLMFVHDAINIIYGDAADLRKEADSLDVISDSIAGLYVLKAGGDTARWRTAMHADTWYSAEAAVAAKLADAVGLDPQMPDNLPPVEDDTDSDDATVIEIDVNLSPAARAAARRFDLSMLPNAPAALAPKTPADQPVTPPTDHKEADTMSDTIPTAGLVKALGLADDADEDTILEAVEAKVTADAALAKAQADLKAAQAAAPSNGQVAVSAAMLDELKLAARAGQEARAQQIREDRDGTINAAINGGFIGATRKDYWTAQWDADSEGARATLAELTKGEPLYPVGTAPGVAGSESSAQAKYTDDMAAEDAAFFGVAQEVLAR